MSRIINFFKAIANFFSRKKPVKPITPEPTPTLEPVFVPVPETNTGLFKFKKGMIGVDISHHNRSVDLKVLARNVDFIYMKATEGKTFVSPAYVRRAKELKELDVAWGAYHYYRVQTSPITQANHFLKYVDANSGLPPVLDIEAITNDFMPYHKKNLLTFLRLVETKTKIKPIIYTGYYFAKDEFRPTEEFARYDLWLPWYTSHFSRVRIPKPWSKLTIWQHTEKGEINGVKGKVDLNKIM